jgi:hypothetical protein
MRLRALPDRVLQALLSEVSNSDKGPPSTAAAATLR